VVIEIVARLKDTGRQEIKAFKQRVLRIAGLGRISKGDADYLVDLADKIDAHIIRMTEKPDHERKEF
jgi:hypothetical protein